MRYFLSLVLLVLSSVAIANPERNPCVPTTTVSVTYDESFIAPYSTYICVYKFNAYEQGEGSDFEMDVRTYSIEELRIKYPEPFTIYIRPYLIESHNEFVYPRIGKILQLFNGPYTVDPAVRVEFNNLVDQLDNYNPRKREEATRTLSLNEKYDALILEVDIDDLSPEVAARLAGLKRKIGKLTPEEIEALKYNREYLEDGQHNAILLRNDRVKFMIDCRLNELNG